MINKKMEELRNEINEMIILEDFDREKLLAKSKELDYLIIKSMRKSIKSNDSKITDILFMQDYF